MNIENKTILITGANRGIGRALVEEALKRGAKRVYAGARQPFTHADGRVTPLTLDVTNAGQIQDAVEKVGALDILINNAGVDLHNDLSDRANLERHLASTLCWANVRTAQNDDHWSDRALPQFPDTWRTSGHSSSLPSQADRSYPRMDVSQSRPISAFSCLLRVLVPVVVHAFYFPEDSLRIASGAGLTP
jgi:NAD(P)-dependent dehydrogenase (short-subunit alcohol dehydrogenase family)